MPLHRPGMTRAQHLYRKMQQCASHCPAVSIVDLQRPYRLLTGPQFHTHGGDIAALDQFAVSLDHVKGRLLSFTPKVNVKHMLADAKIMHGKVRQPGGKVWINVEFVVRRSRQESQ